MAELITVKVKSDLYGLQNIPVDQLAYVSKDNIIYHLKDISRKNKKDGWEATGAVPVNVNNTTITGTYLTEETANSKYVKLQTSYAAIPTSAPLQQMYGDLQTSGDLVAYATSSPTGSFWDNLPIATTTVLGGVKIGSNLTIDINGVLNASGGAGATNWGLIGGDISTQTDLNSGFATKIHNFIDTTNHPVTGLTSGHFLKATAATTYGFVAHGLTATDVGAVIYPANPVDREILIWNDITGNAVRVSTGASISALGHLSVGGDVIAYQSASPSGSYWDNLPAATYNTSGLYGGIILGNGTAKFLREDGTWQTAVGTVSSYPGVGIALSTGSAWDTSITNNSSNWNTAYGWGNHVSAGYAPVASPTFTGTVSGISATMVGLGNVTNESKTTMFNAPTFISTVTINKVSGQSVVSLTSGNNGGSLLQLQRLGAGTAAYIETGANSVDALILHHGSPYTQLVLLPDGKVGVNCIPILRFDVAENADAWVGRFYQKHTTLGNGLQVRSDNVGDLTAPVFATYSNSAYRFWVNGAGKIGVNNSNPQHEVDVTGTIVASGDVIAYHT